MFCADCDAIEAPPLHDERLLINTGDPHAWWACTAPEQLPDRHITYDEACRGCLIALVAAHVNNNIFSTMAYTHRCGKPREYLSVAQFKAYLDQEMI